MSPLRLTLSASVVITFLLSPSAARAECFMQSAKMVMKSSELVFSGTVVEITPTANVDYYRATFDVDRVWKGSVSKRFDFYVYALAEAIDHHEVGRRYVVTAHRLVESRARQRVGLGSSDATAFIAGGCSRQDLLVPTIREDLGRGQPPK